MTDLMREQSAVIIAAAIIEGKSSSNHSFVASTVAETAVLVVDEIIKKLNEKK